MAIGAIAAGLASAAIGGLISHKGARDQRKHQVGEARRQEAFQERMSSTAYQRAVDDMRKAGLNPMLAYTQGGASAPQGTQADIENVVEPAVSSAKQGLLLREEIKNMRAQRRLMETQRNTTDLQGIQASEQAALNQVHAKESLTRAELNEAQKLLLDLQAPGARNRAKVESTELGKRAPYLERIIRMFFGGGPIAPLKVSN